MLPIIVGGILLLVAVALSPKEGFQAGSGSSGSATGSNPLDTNANLQKAALEGVALRVRRTKEAIAAKGGDSFILAKLPDPDKTAYNYSKSVLTAFEQSIDTNTFINQAKLDDLTSKFGSIANLLTLMNTNLATLDKYVNAPSDELTNLKRVITEIQSMWQSIKSNKERQEPYLYRKVFVTDATRTLDSPTPDYNIINKIETIYEDISYVGRPSATFSSNDMLEIQDFDTLSAERKASVRNLVYGIYQQTQLLYYLFVGLPGMIYGSNTVVDSLAVPAPPLEDTAILDQVRSAYYETLAKIPNLDAKITEANTELMAALPNIGTTATTEAQLTVAQKAYYTWERLVRIDLKVRGDAIKRAKAADDSASTTSTPTKTATTATLTGLRTAKSSAIDLYLPIVDIASPGGLYIKLNSLPQTLRSTTPATRKSVTTFQSDISAFKTFLTNAKTATATEGFQSGGNPYNSMPSNKQALEFRLGVRQMINQVGGIAW